MGSRIKFFVTSNTSEGMVADNRITWNNNNKRLNIAMKRHKGLSGYFLSTYVASFTLNQQFTLAILAPNPRHTYNTVTLTIAVSVAHCLKGDMGLVLYNRKQAKSRKDLIAWQA